MRKAQHLGRMEYGDELDHCWGRFTERPSGWNELYGKPGSSLVAYNNGDASDVTNETKISAVTLENVPVRGMTDCGSRRENADDSVLTTSDINTFSYDEFTRCTSPIEHDLPHYGQINDPANILGSSPQYSTPTTASETSSWKNTPVLRRQSHNSIFQGLTPDDVSNAWSRTTNTGGLSNRSSFRKSETQRSTPEFSHHHEVDLHSHFANAFRPAPDSPGIGSSPISGKAAAQREHGQNYTPVNSSYSSSLDQPTPWTQQDSPRTRPNSLTSPYSQPYLGSVSPGLDRTRPSGRSRQPANCDANVHTYGADVLPLNREMSTFPQRRLAFTNVEEPSIELNRTVIMHNLVVTSDRDAVCSMLERFGPLADFSVQLLPDNVHIQVLATYAFALHAQTAVRSLDGLVLFDRPIHMRLAASMIARTGDVHDRPTYSNNMRHSADYMPHPQAGIERGSFGTKLRRSIGAPMNDERFSLERSLRMMNLSGSGQSSSMNESPYTSASSFSSTGSGSIPAQSIPNKYQLNIERVLAGHETRTALMIRNIPNKYTQKMMLQTLEINHRGGFDFFYLPIDFKNKCNVGYAFINFRQPVNIVPFFEEFHNSKWGKFNSEKICKITFARIQGKANLVAHFQNSSLMNEDPKCRPVIFGEYGELEEFPVGPHVRTRRGPSARDVRVDGQVRPVLSLNLDDSSSTTPNPGLPTYLP